MYIDFHTHGKLAKYLPFSIPYTEWLLGEAKNAGLDAICLTEHFNTQQFDEVYAYIADHGERQGDAFVFNGLKVFPGMETDVAENGKDVAENRQRTKLMTYDLAGKIGRPVVAGSDTHQAFQYGCIRTNFEKDFDTFEELRTEMNAGGYTICVHPDAAFRVKTAGLLKRSLKEIHALGEDYVSVLLRTSGESPAVAAAKRKAEDAYEF